VVVKQEIVLEMTWLQYANDLYQGKFEDLIEIHPCHLGVLSLSPTF